MRCVIYAITSPSKKRYIGSARNLTLRKRAHLAALRGSRHHSAPLQRAWDKYGQVTFSVLLVCAERDLLFYEQLLLDGLSPEYNVSPSANGTAGLRWTEEQKAKIRGRKAYPDLVRAGMLAATTPEQRMEWARRARSKWTEESQRAQIAKLTGQKHSPETIAKRAARLVGRPVSIETRQKMAAQKGWKHSDAAKAKMRGRTRSAEHTAKIVAALTGKKRSVPVVMTVQTRQKISATLKGRRRSPEAIARHRATMAARRAMSTTDQSIDYEVTP